MSTELCASSHVVELPWRLVDSSSVAPNTSLVKVEAEGGDELLHEPHPTFSRPSMNTLPILVPPRSLSPARLCSWLEETRKVPVFTIHRAEEREARRWFACLLLKLFKENLPFGVKRQISWITCSAKTRASRMDVTCRAVCCRLRFKQCARQLTEIALGSYS